METKQRGRETRCAQTNKKLRSNIGLSSVKATVEAVVAPRATAESALWFARDTRPEIVRQEAPYGGVASSVETAIAVIVARGECVPV